MHNNMSDFEFDPTLFKSQCVLTKSRRAARTVSRHFGKLLEPHNLTASQASMMFVLLGSETTSVSALAESLGIERSGLTRNLTLLEKAGHVECDIGGRGGAKAYRLSDSGHAKIIALIPLWHHGQGIIRKKLGDEQWRDMQGALTDLSSL